MKQRELDGIERLSEEHEKVLREEKGRKIALYCAILEIEYNPHPDPVELERVSKLVKRLRRWL